MLCACWAFGRYILLVRPYHWAHVGATVRARIFGLAGVGRCDVFIARQPV